MMTKQQRINDRLRRNLEKQGFSTTPVPDNDPRRNWDKWCPHGQLNKANGNHPLACVLCHPKKG